LTRDASDQLYNRATTAARRLRDRDWHLVGAYLDDVADEEATTVLRSIAQQ
jgi:hypothetical protein